MLGVHKMGVMSCTSIMVRKGCSSVVLFAYSCHQTVPISAAAPSCLGSMPESASDHAVLSQPALSHELLLQMRNPAFLHEEWRTSITGCHEGDGQTPDT